MSDSKTEATKAAAPKKVAADSTKPAKAAKPAAADAKKPAAAAATKPAAGSAKKAAASSATKKKEAPKKAAKKQSGKKVARVHNTPAKKRYMVAPVRLRVKVAQEEKLNQLRHLQRRAPKGADKKIMKKKGTISPKKAVLKRLAAENQATQQKIAQKEKDKVARAAGKLVLKKQKTQQPKRTLAPKSKKPKKKAAAAPKATTTEAPKTAVDPKEKLAQIFKQKKEQRKKRNEKEKKLKQRLSAGQQLFISSNPEKAKKKIEKKLKSSPTSLSEYALKKKTAMAKIHSERSKVFAKTGKYPPKPTKEELKAAIAAAKPAKMPQRVTKAAAAKKAETEEYRKKYALGLEKKKKKKEQAKKAKEAPKKAAAAAVKKEKAPAAGAGEAPAPDATAAAPDAKKAAAGPKNVRKPHHKYQAIAIGKNRGYQVTQRVPPPRQARRKGVTSRRVRAIKDIIREVSGFTPYEKRIMELLRNNLDKRALKFAKRRLGTHGRAKKKREEMQGIIQKMRAT
jgi:large subunit ribosomal protein L36e